MTRSDYCGNCNEMVGDDDVMCNECYDSICYDCADTYDATSRVCILTARVNGAHEPNITIIDVKTFYQDIMDEEFQTTLKNKHPNHEIEFLNKIITETKTLVESLTENSNKNMCDSSIIKFKDLIDILRINDWDLFKCGCK